MGMEHTSAYLSCRIPVPGWVATRYPPGCVGTLAIEASTCLPKARVSHWNEHLTGKEKDHSDAGKAPAVGGKSFCSS